MRATSASSSCPVCERGGHEALSCERFTTLQPDDRLQTAIRLRLCFVCLRGGHITWDCTSKTRCKAEDWAHALHHVTCLNWSQLREQGRRRREQTAASHNEETSAEEPLTSGSVYHVQGEENRPRIASPSQGTRTALPLILIRVYSPESKCSHLTYALLDNGSNVTLCHERLLRILNLQGQAETMSLTTLDRAHNHTPTRVISLKVTDPDGEGRLCLGQACPSTHGTWSQQTRLPCGLTWKDCHHTQADGVMLLIGQDYPDVLIPLATMPGRMGEPYAVKTHLGWTVNGPVASRKTPTEQQTFFTQGERFEQLIRSWRGSGSSSPVACTRTIKGCPCKIN